MEHRRVWWIGLPTQRSYIYRRASEYGAVVGLEATQFQRVYTKLLQEHVLLRPYVGAALRVALAGEAIHMAEGKIPLPGEAMLFARAIAELKRYGLGPGDVEPVDQESARLKKVFYQYQRLKEDRMDLDDVRREALRLVEDGNFQLEASLVITDGFRELSPIELRFLKGLASKAEVWVSSPGPVPGIEPAATLPDRGQGLVVYRAPNPVAELRWLLTAIKRDIHVTGLDPLDIALIVPANLVPQVQALASEYQLYLMDESRKSFADFEEGRMLLALLELPDLATPSGLSYIEELEPLSAKAFELGISGNDALLRLSKEVGLEAPYQSWLARLEPSGEPAAWAEKLILSFPQIAASRYKEALLDLAREARWLGAGPDYRRWWSSLISEVSVATRPKGGVALLTPEAGNWEGVNVLESRYPEAALQEGMGLSSGEFADWRNKVREKLYQARKKRIPPPTDDKVLADWNGLALRAFAEVGRLLGEERYLWAARRNAEFVSGHMFHQGLLRHTWRAGKLRSEAYLSDQANYGLGLLELFQATGEARWLTLAQNLAEGIIANFQDPAGGFFDSLEPGLPVRPKDSYDGPYPSGNAATAELLFRLSALMNQAEWRELAVRTVDTFSQVLSRSPLALPALLQAHLVGTMGTELALPAPSELPAAVNRYFLPLTTLITGPKDSLPLLQGREAGAAYLCQHGSCRLPATSLEALKRELRATYPGARLE